MREISEDKLKPLDLSAANYCETVTVRLEDQGRIEVDNYLLEVLQIEIWTSPIEFWT